MRYRLTLISLALGSIATAAALIIGAGLPQRAAFTGRILGGEFVAPELNALAPPFAAVTLAGETVSLRELRGSPVIVNFWATWCPPCRDELPLLQTFYTRHADDGLRVLAVNLSETEATAAGFAASLGLTYHVILDADRTIADLYYFRAPPTTFVLSPRGIITHIFYGPVSERSLQEALAPFIGD